MQDIMKNNFLHFLKLSLMKTLLIFILCVAVLSSCENQNFTVKSENIPDATTMQIQTYNNLTRMSFGIKANDPVGFEPSVKCYESPNWFNFSDWCLYSPTKINQVGIFNRYGTEEENKGGDPLADNIIYDWNFMVSLFEEYQGFYNSVLNTHPGKKDWVIGCISKDDICSEDSYNNEKCIGIEIAPQIEFSMNNEWFDVTPNHCREGKYLKSEDTLGVYGCFITDEFHGYQPEIHPAQQIWYRNKLLSSKGISNYWLMFFQDASTRFDNWAASPLHGQFLVAFKIPAPTFKSSSQNPLTMNISIAKTSDIVTKDYNEMVKDADDGSTHTLIVDGYPMLKVNEPNNPTSDNTMGIQFVDLAKLDDGSIIGYVQISMVIGDAETDEFGICILGLEIVEPTSKIIKEEVGDLPTKSKSTN